MATHSNILAWRMPSTEEPEGLWSTGVARTGYYLSDLTLTHSSAVKDTVRKETLIAAVLTCKYSLYFLHRAPNVFKCSLFPASPKLWLFTHSSLCTGWLGTVLRGYTENPVCRCLYGRKVQLGHQGRWYKFLA